MLDSFMDSDYSLKDSILRIFNRIGFVILCVYLVITIFNCFYTINE